jgi:hypothetical protein
MRTLTAIDLNGAITVNSDVMTNATAVQVLCTQTSGISDGTIVLQGSLNGTNFQNINFADGALGTASPIEAHRGDDKNQITITAGLVATWVINTDVYPFTRLVCVGTTGDRTAITGSWTTKG